MDTNNHKGNSLIHWVSTEASATTVDDEEDDDLSETGGDILEAENDTEQVETEGENEYTTSFRAEDCAFTSTGTNPFFILEPNYQLVLAGGETERIG